VSRTLRELARVQQTPALGVYVAPHLTRGGVRYSPDIGVPLRRHQAATRAAALGLGR
jgi:hypothetical protein